MRFDQFLNRAAQQILTAEGHTKGTDLLGLNLMLRATIERGNLALAARQLLGDASHLFLGHVLVIAIECLPGDDGCVSG